MYHTGAVDDGLVVLEGVVIPAHELHWRFSRASGPGGQGVNTTDSRVQVTFDVATSPSIPDHLRARALRHLDRRLHDGCLTITASEHRSQWRNRQAAEQRLADALREAMSATARTRRPTKPTRASAERRLLDKRKRGMTKRLRDARQDD